MQPNVTLATLRNKMPCPVCGHVVAKSSAECKNCGNIEFSIETGEIKKHWSDCRVCKGTGKTRSQKLSFRPRFTGGDYWYEEIICPECHGEKGSHWTEVVKRDARD